MRFLVCCPAAAVKGGAEQILGTVRGALEARGHEVTFALPSGRFHDPQRFLQAFPGLAIRPVRARAGTASDRQRELQGLVAREKPNIVIVSRLFDALVATARAKAQGLPVRLVCTVFGNEPEYFFDLRTFGPWIDGIVTDSKLAAAAACATSGLPVDRVVAIPGPVKPAVRATQPGPPGAALRLGCAGRLDTHQKRILDLPEVLAELLPHVPFTCQVAGAGPGENALRQRLAELGLAQRVAFSGWLDHDALYSSFYPTLDILLHFAAWEGNPIAPREALAHGVVPVSARFLGVTREGVLRHERTAMLFDVGDTAGAATCVRRLHNARDLLGAMRARAQALVAAWAPEGVGEQWEEFLRRLGDAPVRQGTGQPVSFPAPGRLARMGLPPGLADGLRRLTHRRPTPGDAGSEWPHWSGMANAQALSEYRALLTRLDESADPAPPEAVESCGGAP